jgi:hypothetical protein
VLHFSGPSVLRVILMKNCSARCREYASCDAVPGIGACLLVLGFAWQSRLSWAQVPVTIDDLQDAAINASNTNERVIRRDGKENDRKRSRPIGQSALFPLTPLGRAFEGRPTMPAPHTRQEQ